MDKIQEISFLLKDLYALNLAGAPGTLTDTEKAWNHLS